jgi:formiminoglutamate deiminase
MTWSEDGVTRYFADYAWLPGGLARAVVLSVVGNRFVDVAVGSVPEGSVRLPGIVLPGFANAHSHAFHRALRGRTHGGGGTFWTWRERMYAVAQRLDPDRYLALARATYAEMALAGVTAVGEFHYLHHGPGGIPYADPNAMGASLQQAAAEAGVRLTLLDACYLAGGLSPDGSATGPDGHLPLDAVQRRFADRDVHEWAARATARTSGDSVRLGYAVHSVRAVPKSDLSAVVAAAGDGPLHVHLSEQPAENKACLSRYGCTPTELLHAEGALGPHVTAVHATHLDVSDIARLGASGTGVCFCPTTERDLADGIGPARALHDAGSPLSLGSDQHAVIDLMEEARALEMHERLATGERGRFSLNELLTALVNHTSIGWSDAGRLEAGARADLVAVRLDSVRTTGSAPEQVLLSATSADVDTVVVDGSVVVQGGRHRLGDVAALLAAAIEPLWDAS